MLPSTIQILEALLAKAGFLCSLVSMSASAGMMRALSWLSGHLITSVTSSQIIATGSLY